VAEVETEIEGVGGETNEVFEEKENTTTGGARFFKDRLRK